MLGKCPCGVFGEDFEEFVKESSCVVHIDGLEEEILEGVEVLIFEKVDEEFSSDFDAFKIISHIGIFLEEKLCVVGLEWEGRELNHISENTHAESFAF